MKFYLRQALRNLDIEVKPYGYGDMELTEGLRGYSRDRWLAINPNERWPEFVTFHEMTHILRNDTVLPKDLKEILNSKRTPSWAEFAKVEAAMAYRELNYDIIEAECHVTAIFAAQLTDIPFDFEAEYAFLTNCYTKGRKIPGEVMKRAYATAKKIAAAGKVDERRLVA